jgi:hypothetical protein
MTNLEILAHRLHLRRQLLIAETLERNERIKQKIAALIEAAKKEQPHAMATMDSCGTGFRRHCVACMPLKPRHLCWHRLTFRLLSYGLCGRTASERLKHDGRNHEPVAPFFLLLSDA